jgi:hypothetical protein
MFTHGAQNCRPGSSERYCFEHIAAEGKLILKLALEKLVGNEWNGFD